MADYYVDPAAEGDNDGSSWANAWTSIQTAFDTVTAGNTCYCRGTETTGAAIDVDTRAGTNAGGFIKFIGCNAAGAVDGTRFVINANGGSYHVTNWTSTALMYWLENIEVKNNAGNYEGFNFGATTAGKGSVFINCCANNCRHGWNLAGACYNIYFCCVSYSNRSDGFYNSQFDELYLCCSRDNTRYGFHSATASSWFGCISHGNTDDGFTPYYRSRLVNCVVDGNVDDGCAQAAHTDATANFYLGCRITNHSGAGDIGLNANSEPTVTAHCYFEDNDGDNIQNATLHYNIPLEGGSSTSNMEDQANTDEGYVDKGNHDFSTRYVDASNPSLRRRGITIPWS